MSTKNPEAKGINVINHLSEELETNTPTENIAIELFKQTKHNRYGRSITLIASASYYLACKQTNLATSPDDIINTLDTEDTRKQLLRMVKTLNSELSLAIDLFNPDSYITDYCDQLDLPEETETLAKQIVTLTTQEGAASGRSPTGFAAAAVYYASVLTHNKRTQQQISAVADTSEVTIRNTYQLQANCVGDKLNTTYQ